MRGRKKPRIKLYLMVLDRLWMPDLYGPYDSEEDRVAVARILFKEDYDPIITIDAEGDTVTVGSYDDGDLCPVFKEDKI